MNAKLVFAAKPAAVVRLMASTSFATEILSFLMGTEMRNPFHFGLFGTVLNFVMTIYIFIDFTRVKETDTPGIADGKDFGNNHNEEGVLDSLDIVLGNKRRKGCVSDSPPQSMRTNLKAMCAPNMACACDESGQSSKVKFTTTNLSILFVTVLFLPFTAAALTISSGFRVLAGVGASGTAVAVIPLRTLPEVHNTAWIITYVVWAVFFSVYLGMQVLLIPSEMSYRRKWFLSCVIIAAVHFSIGLAQTSTTLEDSFTIFGPLIATMCTYVMSLIFSGNGDVDLNTRHEGVAVFRAAFGT